MSIISAGISLLTILTVLAEQDTVLGGALRGGVIGGVIGAVAGGLMWVVKRNKK
jgi:hypothetical protein